MEKETGLDWCSFLSVNGDITRNWEYGTIPKYVFTFHGECLSALLCQDKGHSKLGGPLRFPLIQDSLLLSTPPKLSICHFYFRSWCWGSEWLRRDSDCRWYFGYPKAIGPLDSFETMAGAISTRHIKVSVKQWCVQCPSRWYVEWRISCWWSDGGRVLCSQRTKVELPRRSPVRMENVFAH